MDDNPNSQTSVTPPVPRVPQAPYVSAPQPGAPYRANGGLQAWLIFCIVMGVVGMISIIAMRIFVNSPLVADIPYTPYLGRSWNIYAGASMVLGCVAIFCYVLILRGKKIGFYVTCGLMVLSSVMAIIYYASASYPLGMIIWVAIAPWISVLITWLLMRKQWQYFS